MSLAGVPDDGEMYIAGFGMWCPGRQLRAASGVPVVWVSDRAIGGGLVWGDLAEESAESGLQPFLLSGMDGGTARPWDTGEQVSEPEDTRVGRTGSARGCSRWASTTSGSWSAGHRRPCTRRSRSPPSTSRSATRPTRGRAMSARSRAPW
jgi:hypothetical protein